MSERKLAKKEDLLTPDTITKEDVKKLFCPEATDKEITIFLQIAKLNQLNPLKREIYLIKYLNTPAHVVTGYETYLKRAERSGHYAGFKVWIEGEGETMKACIEVRRKDWDKPLYHEVEYSEYVGKKRDGSVTKFWAKMPKTMLKKVVISQGLRFAFPDELAGMPYVREEIQGDETVNGVEKDVEFEQPKEETPKIIQPGENPQTEEKIGEELEGIDFGDDPAIKVAKHNELVEEIYAVGNKKGYLPGTVRESIEKKYQKDINMVTTEELEKYLAALKNAKPKAK